MPKVTLDDQGRLVLPEAILQRQRISPDREYWLEEREGDLILHPRLPDARKLYIEPTTGCNLNCRTCIRNIWEDPIAPMSMATFERLVAGLNDLPRLNRVVFTGFGEPLTHPHILEMIQAVRERDPSGSSPSGRSLAVTIGSNGLLLTAEKSR